MFIRCKLGLNIFGAHYKPVVFKVKTKKSFKKKFCFEKIPNTLVTLKLVGGIRCYLKCVSCHPLANRKKEGMSSNGKHETCFK